MPIPRRTPESHASMPFVEGRARCAFLLRSALLAVCILLSLPACRQPELPDEEMQVDSTDTRSKDLNALLEETERLTRFRRALEEAGMLSVLEEAGPITVFAPTDAAFARTSFRLDTLLSDAHQDTLRKVVSLHLVRGRFTPVRVPDSLRVSTLLEESLLLKSRQEGQTLTVDGQEVLAAIEAQNGVLYVIDAVLRMPPPDTTAQALVQPQPEDPSQRAPGR